MAFFKERTFTVCECECPIGSPTSPDDVDNGLELMLLFLDTGESFAQ